MEIKVTGKVIYARLENGSKAYLTYTIKNGKIEINRTYTPPEHRGKGIAAKLMDKAVEIAQKEGYKIVPVCSYAVYYFIKNPDKKEVLADEFRKADLKELFKRRLSEEKQ